MTGNMAPTKLSTRIINTPPICNSRSQSSTPDAIHSPSLWRACSKGEGEGVELAISESDSSVDSSFALLVGVGSVMLWNIMCPVFVCNPRVVCSVNEGISEIALSSAPCAHAANTARAMYRSATIFLRIYYEF
ncbi:hypothetical protein GGH17_000821 [Coemansia sp. RSA 788]|nr:hypothetical protein GGH17_000821 [Coemansia sp. RSA 788]